MENLMRPQFSETIDGTPFDVFIINDDVNHGKSIKINELGGDRRIVKTYYIGFTDASWPEMDSKLKGERDTITKLIKKRHKLNGKVLDSKSSDLVFHP